jgi:hypothetical protein
VNGKRYTVMAVGECGANLRGPRGGGKVLVQNIHNPSVWTLIDNSARATRVTSIEAI